MDEKKLYHEVPGGKNKFHSAILTTYSFNFHHFEYQILKTLKQKWIINVGVLVDANKLDEVLGFSSGGLKQLTKSYSINGVHSKGAFHPKINFLIGDKQLLLVLGSGNLTPGGQGKNHETFTALYAEDEDSKLIPILNEAYDYVKALGKDLEGFSARRIEKSIPNNCKLLRKEIVSKHQYHQIDDDMDLALLYNDETSILSQLGNLIPLEKIKRIRILSPYYDKDGRFLNELADLSGNAKLEVYLPSEFGLPPVDMEPNKRISFYKWEETKRAQIELTSPESYGRKLHSKVFLFETEEESYFMIGSANATRPAFGTLEKRGVNDEFDLLYKTKKRDFFKELGVSGKKMLINPNELTRESIIISAAPDDKPFRIRKVEITNCDIDGINVVVNIKTKDEVEGVKLCIHNDIGDVIFNETMNLVVAVKFRIALEILQKNPAYVTVQDESGVTISNKQVINFVDKLYDTDPSYENRTIRGVRNALEIGKINEFQLMEYLNIARTHGNEDTNVRAIGDNTKREDIQEFHANLTYAETMEMSKNKSLESKLITQHNSVQFWQSISQVFKQRFDSTQESLIEEEETGSAEKSHERQSETEEIERVFNVRDNAESNRILSRSENLASQYVSAVSQTIPDNDLKLNEVVFCQFLLVGHILSAILQFNKYQLPQNKKGKYTVYTPERWEEILQGKYHVIMQNVLLVFAKLCLKHDVVSTEDEFREGYINNYIDEVLSNVVLYHYFINKNSALNPHMEITNLACLTIFDKLGFPSEEVVDKLEMIASSESDELFDIRSVNKLRIRLSALQVKCNEKESYFFHPHFGVCLLKSKTDKTVKYKTIFDGGYFREMNLSDWRKL